MNTRKCIARYFLVIFCIFNVFFLHAQSNKNYWATLFKQSYYSGFKKLPPLRQQWIDLSISRDIDDMQPLSYGLDAVLAMFEVTDSTNYLNDAVTLTNNVVSRAQVTKNIPGNKFVLRDSYKGWVGENPKRDLYGQEGLLSEIYFFQYVARLLKDIHNRPSLYKNGDYKKFYDQTLDFVETNIWDKWVNRGIRYANNGYNYLLLNRTHMASHWAYIAAELSGLTNNIDRKTNYIIFVNKYNNQLEKNFYKYDKYISWNQIWDTKQDDKKNQNNDDNVQDVSHANLVVSYIVESYDLGLWKDSDVVQRLINTVRDKLWDPLHCLFKDNMDGTMFKPGNKGSVGSFQADGFVKLSRYDKTLFSIYEKFVDCSPLLTKWFQYGQLFANLALSKKILKKFN